MAELQYILALWAWVGVAVLFGFVAGVSVGRDYPRASFRS